MWLPDERADQEEELWLAGHMLFDPQAPLAVQESDGWQLGPVSDAALNGEASARAARRTLGHGSARVLALRDRNGLVALMEVLPALDPLAKALTAAAKR